MKRLLLYVFLIINILHAQELDIEGLLGDIEKKSDLSSKTKLENGGISTIYTRDDLQRMQAKTLKDIFKSANAFGYQENVFGLSDPYFMGTQHPYVSSSIRIFLDNVEITTGLYGSGLIFYGDIDLDFIDHIEIYNGNPTYEFSTEPTYVLVKLYSKSTQKDEGSRLNITGTDLGGSFVSFYNAGELNSKWSYFAYASGNNDKRNTFQSHNTQLSRDKKVSHIFTSLENEDNKITLDAGRQKRDAFIGQSLDATPLNSSIDSDYLHFGYTGKYDNFSSLFSYDFLKTDTKFKDDVTPLALTNYMSPIQSYYTKSSSFAISGELKYTYETDINSFITGLKYRYKGFKYNEILRNGFDIPRSGHTKQTIATAFIENQYSIAKNSIVTTGISASQVRNNNSLQDDNLLMYRLGHTYTTDSLVFKTIYSHLELSLDPYLVDTYNLFITPGKKDITKQDMFFENIIHEKENNKYELTLSYIKTKKQLMPDFQSGLLYNYPETITFKSGLFAWTHTYNKFDKLYTNISYTQVDNVPIVDKLKEYRATLRNINTYGKFDIFNELLWFRDHDVKENFYDYSAGFIYHATKDLSIKLKATNIFNDAQKASYPRVNPQTFQPEESLQISPIDRRVLLSLEYLF